MRIGRCSKDKRWKPPKDAIAEGVRRVEDLATGKVKGVKEAEFRREIRKRAKHPK